MPDIPHDPFRQIEYLHQALASDKRPIGFLLGAGCPMSVKVDENVPLIPDIASLTNHICTALSADENNKGAYESIRAHFAEDERSDWNIESILSHIRSLKAVAGRSTVRGMSSTELENLDGCICEKIHSAVSKSLPSIDTPYHKLGLWIDATSRDTEVELFTTNYDLLVEQALEDFQIPFFDGFTGSNNPFFDIRSIDEDILPSRWARVWKLHGSINWHQDGQNRITRCKHSENGCKRLIHPSHLKYDESRRMPYLAMIDRLKSFLRKPSAVLITCGYSFGDEHINEVILQGLQSTQTSTSFCLMFGEMSDYQKANALANRRPNMNLLAKDKAVIGGREASWIKLHPNEYESKTTPWTILAASDDEGEHSARAIHFSLGNFSVFGDFLLDVSGKKSSVEEPSHEE